MLLFLLAIASIPGSVLPQRPVDPAKVSQYLIDNRVSGSSSTPSGSSTFLSAVVRRRLLAALHFPRWLHHSANPVALQSDAGTAPQAPSRLTRLLNLRRGRPTPLKRRRSRSWTQLPTNSAAAVGACARKNSKTRQAGSRRKRATCAKPATSSSTSRCWHCSLPLYLAVCTAGAAGTGD